MSLLPDEARQLLSSGALGHVITRNPDGGPQVSVVWIDVDGDDVLFFAQEHRRKIRNLVRDPQVLISVESAKFNPGGLRQHLVVTGRATIVRDDPAGLQALADRLTQRYMGKDNFPFSFSRPGVVVRVAVDRLGGEGPWGHVE